jgi:hypothetical protein
MSRREAIASLRSKDAWGAITGVDRVSERSCRKRSKDCPEIVWGE